MGEYIESGAIKVIEVIGVSQKSFEDAIDVAVAKASESIAGISGVEVKTLNAKVEDGKVVQYRAALKLAFTVR